MARIALTTLLRRIRVQREGTALIEFAIAFPVLLLMFTGVVEISRYVLFKSKLDAAGMQMLDIVNQNTNVNTASLANLVDTLPSMLAPYAGISEAPIFTHVMRPTDASNPSRVCQPVVVWRSPRGTKRSKIASSWKAGSAVNIGSIQLVANSSLMAIEIYTTYSPLIDKLFTKDLFGDLRIYSINYASTRYGAFLLDPATQNKIRVPCN